MNLYNLSLIARNYFLGTPDLSLFKRDIIGLYLDNDQLQYICLKWSPNGWCLTRPSPALEPFGVVQGYPEGWRLTHTSPAASKPFVRAQEQTQWSLKQFLEWLTVFPLVEKDSTPRERSVYLTLPGSQFSFRDLKLPPMPMEDALSSAQNSLSVNCHLPVEEIYHDIHLCRTRKGNINALIIYAPRKDMDIYLKIFRETGQLEILEGIFPASLGVGAWINMQKYPLPMGLVFSNEGLNELAIYQEGGCLFSGSWPVTEGEKGKDALVAAVKSKFLVPRENIFSLDQEEFPVLPSPSKNHLDQLPLITENMGIAAAAPVLSGLQEISVDGRETRLKTFHPSRLAAPLILVLVMMISLVTAFLVWDVSRHKEKIEVIGTEISDLERELTPLEETHKKRREIGRYLADARAFKKARPILFSHINEVARLMPEGTWFSRFEYKKGSMTFKGESPDALKVVEMLRASKMFEQVNLKGPVDRKDSETERFNLMIKAKADEADK